jgi:hypothetical protein
MSSCQFIERSRHARKPFTYLFRFAANSDAEMVRRIEKAPGHNAGLIFFQQELAKRVSMPAGELRKRN